MPFSSIIILIAFEIISRWSLNRENQDFAILKETYQEYRNVEEQDKSVEIN